VLDRCIIRDHWQCNEEEKVTIVECKDGTCISLKPGNIISITQPNWEDIPCFKADFTFGNLAGNLEKLHHFKELQYCSDKGGHIFEKYIYTGDFHESLELKWLPFDRQLLRISIYAEPLIDNMQFVPFKDLNAGVVKNTALPNEWALSENVAFDGFKYPSASLICWAHKKVRSSVQVVVHVDHDPKFFFYNVFLVNFLITMASGTAFAAKPEDFSDRAGIQFTILLTSVGYKIVTSSWMPVKSYLTIMDKYILFNFLFQLFLILENWYVCVFWCTEVQDDDPHWWDGAYTGRNKERSPPSFECHPNLRAKEFQCLCYLYGGWFAVHAMAFLLHCVGMLERFLRPTWKDCYNENFKDGVTPVTTIQECWQHPYKPEGTKSGVKKEEEGSSSPTPSWRQAICCADDSGDTASEDESCMESIDATTANNDRSAEALLRHGSRAPRTVHQEQ
jgi:hypothetical protein